MLYHRPDPTPCLPKRRHLVLKRNLSKLTASLLDVRELHCKRRVHPLPGPSGPQLSDRQPGPPSTPVDAETPAGNTEMLGHWEFASRAAQRFHPATEPIGKRRPPLSVTQTQRYLRRRRALTSGW